MFQRGLKIVAALCCGCLLGCSGNIVGEGPAGNDTGGSNRIQLSQQAGEVMGGDAAGLSGAENPLQNIPGQPRPGGGIVSPATPLGAGYPHPTADLHGAPGVALDEMKTLCEGPNGELLISLSGYLYRQDVADNGIFNGVSLRMVETRRNKYVDTRSYAQPRKDGPVSYVRDGYFKLTIRTDPDWPLILYMLPAGWISPSYDTVQNCSAGGCYPDFSAVLGFDHAFLTEHRHSAPKCVEVQALVGEGRN